MKKSTLSIAGMLVIGVLAFVYMGTLGLPVSRESDDRRVTMEVSDGNGLVPGARVLLRGVEIGTVASVRPSARGVTIGMKYRPEYQIPTESTFRIETLSALGEPYVAVTPAVATGPYIAEDAVIGRSQVDDPSTFKDLSERVTRLLEQVDPKSVGKIFETLDVALPGPCTDGGVCTDDEQYVLGSINRAGERLASTIGGQADNLTTLLSALQPLLMRSGEIPAAFRGAAPAAEGFGRNLGVLQDALKFAVFRGGPLATGIEDGAGPFLMELQKFLDNTAADLKVIGDNLLPTVSAGAGALRTVDPSAVLGRALGAVRNGSLHVEAGVPGS